MPESIPFGEGDISDPLMAEINSMMPNESKGEFQSLHEEAVREEAEYDHVLEDDADFGLKSHTTIPIALPISNPPGNLSLAGHLEHLGLTRAPIGPGIYLKQA